MEAGTQVRLVGDPSRIGVLTGRKRGTRLQVQFPNTTSFVPEDQLEAVEKVSTDPFELLEQGRLGRAIDLRRVLTHVRLTGRLADLIYSMETTKTDFYPYQFKPVLKMLNAPNNGLLIADEVGLGKTIEAGLIWTELRSRFDFRRLLVLCPSMLRKKWRRELSVRFGVEAEILGARETHERLERALRAGSFGSFAIVGSIQGLRPSKSSRASRELLEFLEEYTYEEPIVDFLIVDEAHYLKNPESKSHRLGQRLRHVASHVAFLSATPVHLGSPDLFHLLHLLDENTFHHQGIFDEVLRANAPLVRARDAMRSRGVTSQDLISLLEQAQRHPLLRGNRQLLALLDDPPSEEELADRKCRSELAYKLGEMNLLGHVVTRTRKRDVAEWHVERDPVPEEIPLTKPERRFYKVVTEIVRRYCAVSDAHEGFLLVMPQRQMSSSMPAALRSWQQRGKQYWGEQLYEDFGAESEEDLDIGPLTLELISQANQLGDLDELWANDSKYRRLKGALSNFLQENPQEKVVLFSYFRPTLDYLRERLTEDGFTNIVLKGGKGYDKDQILQDFEAVNGPQILLSTEVASEGIDLQFSRVLVNYDLPWNPMKIEQRIGRIDRIGQKAPKITIWNLFYGDTIDARIYTRLYDRLRVFKYALGGIEPVLGEEIRKLTSDLLRGQLTPEEEKNRIEQTAQALENRQQEEERLESKAAHLVAHGDYILNQVKASRHLQRWVASEDLSSYVLGYFNLHYPGCSFQKVSTGEEVYEVALSIQAKHDLEYFIRARHLHERTLLTRNSTAPITCRFDNAVVKEGDLLEEVINHFHPLVRFVSHKLEEAEGTQYPAAAVELEQHHLKDPVPCGTYVYTLQRWSVTGLRDQEKLDYMVLSLDAPDLALSEEQTEGLIMTAAAHGRDWMQAANVVNLERAVQLAFDRCQPASDERFKQFREDIRNRNEDLADIQEQTLDTHLRNQRSQLLRIRDEHLRLGRSSLAKATEGRLNKLENSVARKKLAIEERREVRYASEDISVGLIHIVSSNHE